MDLCALKLGMDSPKNAVVNKLSAPYVHVTYI